MKKLSFLLLLLLACANLQAQELLSRHSAAASAGTAALRWQRAEHNFGEIPQGGPVSATFYFTNTSSEPLQIQQVKGSCGCTVTTYSKEAVAPGAQGFVTATYNAAHPGVFRKTVSVTVSGPTPEMVLTLQGSVLAKQ